MPDGSPSDDRTAEPTGNADSVAPTDRNEPAADTAAAPTGNGPAVDAAAATAGDEPVGGRAESADGETSGGVGLVGIGAETPVGERAGFRLAAFGAVLVVVLFAGYGLGRLNNSTAAASAPPVGATQTGAGQHGATQTGAAQTGAAMPGMTMDESQPHAHNTDGTVSQSGVAMPMGAAVGGLSLSSGGLTLVPETTSFAAGRSQRLSFRVAGAGGAAVTTYAVVHDKPLHLIVVRRDLTGFQHLHPTMAADGTWGIDLTLAEPGIYRMIADFTAIVGGQQIAATLGGDLTVAGNYAPQALPAPGRSAGTDGFSVSYEGTPDTKATQPVLMTVTGADGKIAKLEPYLAAFGHLVVMREGDLAYVHVHPEAALVDGKVKFWLTAPSSGRYRMFFDFQVAGKVHTAAWTLKVD